MQCQWFKNAERARHIYARHEGNWDRIATLNKTYLFMGCKTGRVLKSALGEDLCEEIEWMEASPEIGDRPSAKFPPDLEHIRAILAHFEPNLVICFGKVAAEGVKQVFSGEMIEVPHPAARQPGVFEKLRDLRLYIDTLTLETTKGV